LKFLTLKEKQKCKEYGDEMKKILLYVVIGFMLLTGITPVAAHCPVCTAAVGTGVVTARVYGIDDSITGLWIGAFIVTTVLWFNRKLKKRYIPFQGSVLSLIALLITIVPLYSIGIWGNTGIGKLLLGILVGSLVTGLASFVSNKVRQKRGRRLFRFQTVAFIVSFLILTSLIFYLIS